MSNRFKVWLPDEDERIFESPETCDDVLAREFQRTEYAVRCRRANLAVKMHMQHPEISLEECAASLRADPAQAHEYLTEWRNRTNTVERFIQNRKRSPVEAPEPDEDLPPRPAKARAGSAREPVRQPKSTIETIWKSAIDTICAAIRDEEGQLSHLWNDEDMVPTLIQFYPGFRAYAEHVRGM